MPPIDSDSEHELHTAWERGDYDRVATVFMQCFGSDVLAFLCDRLGNATDADEAFSVFAEDLWRGLPGFRWRATLRGWAFTLARNAANRLRRDPRRRRENNQPLPESSNFAQAVAEARTRTPAHRRSDVKSRLRELRSELPEEYQTLLVLRIDQGLSWPELASVLSGLGDALDDAARERWAVRLRQRFKRVKDGLRARAVAEGLLNEA